jgi:hypothetical protein
MAAARSRSAVAVAIAFPSAKVNLHRLTRAAMAGLSASGVTPVAAKTRQS